MKKLLTLFLIVSSLAFGQATVTRSGLNVQQASLVFTTPVLGAATATTLNLLTITSSTGTFTLTNAKVFTVTNTLTLAGTDGSTLNVGAGGTLGTGAFQPQTVLTGTANQISVSNSGVGGTTVAIVSSAALPGSPTVAGTASTASGGVVTNNGTQTLQNKRNSARITTISSSATPTVNTDNCDCVTITALAADITSMTSGLSGTPVNFDQLEYRIVGTATRAITWGASFVAGPTALPTTTSTTKALHVFFEWDSVQSKWVCLSSGSDA